MGSSCLQARNDHIKGLVEHVSALPRHVQEEPIYSCVLEMRSMPSLGSYDLVPPLGDPRS